ncbi:Disintegrin and metalloproteinase domain-containing protein 9 [Varanus komodoensis]|nr:Disintegrin and metalloproteinase domain-containing protein 9 [Varanus komodoensis]
MPVYTYNAKGDLIADYPYIQDNCYYSGFVEGAGDSQAVLSTCRGLWGHVEIGSLSYEIEPIENSPTFQHLIYRKTPEPREPCRGVVEGRADLTSELIELRMVDADDPVPPLADEHDADHYTSNRYLEYYAVVDRSTFVANKCNETRLVLIMLLMMVDVHSVFLPLGLRIYLVGLELWTERDYIPISRKNLGTTMNAFYKYAHYELRHRVHFDHAAIITAKGDPAGLAWGDRFCLHSHVSVSAVRTHVDPESDATVMAHELGHSFGFGHDDTPAGKARGCDCGCSMLGSCLMAAAGPGFPWDKNSNLHTIYINTAWKCKRLSNCSRKVYYSTISKPGKECLLDIPAKIFRKEVCGNGIIDDSEECDCGRNEDLEGTGILKFFTKPSGEKWPSQRKSVPLRGVRFV